MSRLWTTEDVSKNKGRKEPTRVLKGFKIESGLEIPPSLKVGGIFRKGSGKYPFTEMEVGECLTYTLEFGDDPVRVAGKLTAAARKVTRDTKGVKQFVARTLREEGVIRVWRIEDALPSQAK